MKKFIFLLGLTILLSASSIGQGLVLLKSDTLTFLNSDDTLIQSVYFKKYILQVEPLFFQFDDVMVEKRIAHFPDTVIVFERARKLPLSMKPDDTVQVGNQTWDFYQVLEFIHSNNVQGIQQANQYFLQIKGY